MMSGFPNDHLSGQGSRPSEGVVRGTPGSRALDGRGVYVGFTIDGQEVGLEPHGHSQGMTGPVGGWRRGAARGQRCRWGKLIATVKDGNSNIIGFIQPP
jgi:hypothetical protein